MKINVSLVNALVLLAHAVMGKMKEKFIRSFVK